MGVPSAWAFSLNPSFHLSLLSCGPKFLLSASQSPLFITVSPLSALYKPLSLSDSHYLPSAYYPLISKEHSIDQCRYLNISWEFFL